MVNLVMQRVPYIPFMLSLVVLNVVMLSVVMLSVVMRSVAMLSFVILSVVMLSFVILSVVMMSVMAPLKPVPRRSLLDNMFCYNGESFITLVTTVTSMPSFVTTRQEKSAMRTKLKS
jgi:hypothetical protein